MNENSQHDDKDRLPGGKKLIVVAGKLDQKTIERLVDSQKTYSVMGLWLGFVCIIAGVILLLVNVSGSLTWKFQIPGLSSELSQAAPGALLFVAGACIVFATRFSIRLRK